MASQSERSRNNVKAGLFVSAGLALAFAVILIIGDGLSLLQPWTSYTVRFKVLDGVNGLAKGSPVRIGGLEQGRVMTVTPELNGAALEFIDVSIELPPDIELYTNARAVRVNPILGTQGWINFPDVGGPEGGTRLEPGATIDATASPGLLASAFGPENIARTGNIIKNVDELMTDVKRDYAEYVPDSLSNVEATTENIRDTTARIREDYPGWNDRLVLFLDKANVVGDQTKVMLDEGREVVAQVNDMVADNRPKVNEIVENVRVASGDVKDAGEDVKEITARVRAESVDKLNALLDRGRQSIDRFEGLIQSVDADIASQMPAIQNMVADLRLTAQQLKLGSMEIRRSPWKLLYRPSTQELEHEMLYDAARSFAVAAAQVSDAAESFDRILTNHGPQLQANPELTALLEQSMTSSLERYKIAQEQLFSVLLRNPVTE